LFHGGTWRGAESKVCKITKMLCPVPRAHATI
jgi:hypothetical protein